MTAAVAIGRRIRAAREAAGLSQQALADKVGTDQTKVSKWERGAAVPETARLARLAAALGVTPDALLTDAAARVPAVAAPALGVARYEALRRALAEAVTADAAKDIADRAEAARVYARQAKDRELEIHAAEIRIRAERRLGEILVVAKQAGQLAEGRPRGLKNPSSEEGFSRVVLSDAGIDYKLSMRAQELAAVPAERFEGLIDEWHARAERDAARVSVRLVGLETKATARAAREAALGARIAALPDLRFGLVHADPAWSFTVRSDAGQDRAAANHYPVQGLADILDWRLPVRLADGTETMRGIGEIAAADAVLALWATVPMLADALTVMQAWGFAYVSQAVWVKRAGDGAAGRPGMGYWFRVDHEVLLIGRRGGVPCPAEGDRLSSVHVAAPGRHSAKPDYYSALLEQYFPTLPRVELNARAPRPGWWSLIHDAAAGSRLVGPDGGEVGAAAAPSPPPAAPAAPSPAGGEGAGPVAGPAS